MQKSVILLLAATLTLSSCGGWRDSRANPRNWFGGSSSTPVEATDASGEAVNPLIPQKSGSGVFSRPDAEDLSVPIQTVTELVVEQTLAGAIVRATGIAQRQGAYAAVLRPDLPADGEAEAEAKTDVLGFTFRVVYPEDATPAGGEHSRTVNAAVTLTRKDLEGIKTIRVTGETNIRETRRK